MAKKRKKSNPKVNLHLAFGWKCPKCSQRNFTDGIFIEFSPDEQKMMAAEYGCHPSQFATGQIITKPEAVQCSKCNKDFKVKPDKPHGNDPTGWE
jgi:phage FluMu protein Com